MELYPAESRLVDQANQFHLWVMAEGESIPVGWFERNVYDDEHIDVEIGSSQRPLDDDVEQNPPSREQVEEALRHLTQ
jgi:hypothetical protein